MKINRLICIFWMLFFSFHLFGIEELGDQALERQVLKIADQLRCPICQGLSVKESDTVIAENMKSEIRSRLLAGKSESEILEFFQARYGEWILRVPNKKGINLLAWVLPFIVFLIFLVFIYLKFRSWRISPQEEAENEELSSEEEEKFQTLFRSK